MIVRVMRVIFDFLKVLPNRERLMLLFLVLIVRLGRSGLRVWTGLS